MGHTNANFYTKFVHFILASLMQFLAECFITVAGAVWTRNPLPLDEYNSVWGAMVYKLTYVIISTGLLFCISFLIYELSITYLD